MRIDIVTVFPEMIRDALAHSIVRRAIENSIVSIDVINLRDFTTDRHKTTDDLPYGGGGGMVMKIEPIARAVNHLVARAADATGDRGSFCTTAEPAVDPLETAGYPCATGGPRIILTDPRGERFNQEMARQWAAESHLILLCGHYEGVDDRVRQHLVTNEVSIGDYVLTGGELPALVIVDALTRLQPGALGDSAATQQDSFAEDLLEYPHYTRPREYAGWKVPEILLSGHHAEITRWRRWRQLHETFARRPDLFERFRMSKEERKLFHGPEPTAPMDDKPKRRSDAPAENNEETDGTGL